MNIDRLISVSCLVVCAGMFVHYQKAQPLTNPLVLRNPENSNEIILDVGANGPSVTLKRRGRQCMTLGGSNEGGTISLWNPSKKCMLQISNLADKAGVIVADEKGNPRITIGYFFKLAQIVVQDASGKRTATIPVPK